MHNAQEQNDGEGQKITHPTEECVQFESSTEVLIPGQNSRNRRGIGGIYVEILPGLKTWVETRNLNGNCAQILEVTRHTPYATQRHTHEFVPQRKEKESG